jgi:hypothetical protein
MSHTNRRRKSRTPWEQGRKRLPQITLRPKPMARKRPAVSTEERDGMVTDHAIVRWLERVLGIDVRGRVQADMLACGRDQLIAEMGQGRLHLAAYNVCLVIKAGKVITVAPEGEHA